MKDLEGIHLLGSFIYYNLQDMTEIHADHRGKDNRMTSCDKFGLGTKFLHFTTPLKNFF